jgi:hypothetical protein
MCRIVKERAKILMLSIFWAISFAHPENSSSFATDSAENVKRHLRVYVSLMVGKNGVALFRQPLRHRHPLALGLQAGEKGADAVDMHGLNVVTALSVVKNVRLFPQPLLEPFLSHLPP